MTEAKVSRLIKRRVMTERGDELVVTLAGPTLTLRPKGTRSGGPAEVVLDLGVLYLRAQGAQANFDTRPTRRRRGSA